MQIESKEIAAGYEQHRHDKSYKFHLIKYNNRAYLRWEEVGYGITLDFDQKSGFIEIRGNANEIFDNLNIVEKFSPRDDKYSFRLRGDSHELQVEGYVMSMKSLKHNPENKLLDEIFTREVNYKPLPHSSIANALRLLMKVSRDKSKVLPPPKGAQHRGYWQGEALYSLKVLRDKTIESPFERMRDVFSKLTKGDRENIKQELENHYKKKATIYNRGAIESRINQALYLLGLVRLEVGELPPTANSDMKKAFKACQEIRSDSRQYEAARKFVPDEVVRGSVAEGEATRSDSYMEAVDEGRVRFDTSANVIREISMTSPDIRARQMHPDTKARILERQQRRLVQHTPQAHHVSVV